ncbi:MAG: hypothetical protein QNK37_25150 [Acidobacteriota bacterium]|nr:hypothetical protein [Acidobacteriota bacterium]
MRKRTGQQGTDESEFPNYNSGQETWQTRPGQDMSGVLQHWT